MSFPQLTRVLNLRAEAKLRGYRAKIAFVGSFVSVRVEDPAGTMTVKNACGLEQIAHSLFTEHKLVAARSCGIQHMMDGVVMTWRLS